MSPHHPRSSDTPAGEMEVPQAVIAQAEAAASSNQPGDGKRHPQYASDQTSEALGSKENRLHSWASGQKYAYISAFLTASLVPYLLDPQTK